MRYVDHRKCENLRTDGRISGRSGESGENAVRSGESSAAERRSQRIKDASLLREADMAEVVPYHLDLNQFLPFLYLSLSLSPHCFAAIDAAVLGQTKVRFGQSRAGDRSPSVFPYSHVIYLLLFCLATIACMSQKRAIPPLACSIRIGSIDFAIKQEFRAFLAMLAGCCKEEREKGRKNAR